MYAKLAGEPRVFLVSSYLDSTFNRTTFDLRDKSVLKLDREKIDTMEVNAARTHFAIREKVGEWQIAEPPAGRADFQRD